jgi:biopolymer transport protein ExbD
MASTQQTRRGQIVGINVTPMVDVVLVLLVIMMVSATYIVAQSLKVELPKTATSDEATPSLAAVTVTKDRALFYNDERVDDATLARKLAGAYAANNDVSLVVSADKDAFHGDVVHVIDLAKVAGITKFALNIERK